MVSKLCIEYPNGFMVDRIFIGSTTDKEDLRKWFRITTMFMVSSGKIDIEAMPELDQCRLFQVDEDTDEITLLLTGVSSV